MFHVMKLLVERQRLISYVKLGMFNYYFITVSNYMLVFVIIFVSRYILSNVVAGYKWILCRGYGFAMGLLWVRSYFLTLALSVNGFAELPATNQ